MKLWTIQPVDVWHQIQRGGSAHVDALRISGGKYIPPAYEWLLQQLASRRDWDTVHLSWWCYCEKPDLRCHRHCGWKQSVEVRLELEVSPERVFAMPSWAWNKVYCQDYLALTEPEERDWNERMLSAVPLEPGVPDDRFPLWPLPEPWVSVLRASWEKLFDSRLPASDWGAHSTQGFEAVIQEIRYDDVRKATEFIRTPSKLPARPERHQQNLSGMRTAS